MSNVSDYDEERIHKLHEWLLAKGIDVVREGHDLAMPSPFKEREKRRTEGHGYVDHARRLWVTVKIIQGLPTIFWSCWFTKRKDTGKNMGGRSAYALSVRTGVPEQDIMAMLDLEFDEVVHQSDEMLDKVDAILTQPFRDEARREKARQEAAGTPALDRVPYEQPPRLIPLFMGSEAVWRPEQMLLERGIDAETSRRYACCWDADAQAILFPWATRDGRYAYHQWWDGRRYRFPAKDGVHFQKENLVFGLDLWVPEVPLTLCEGTFDAMTIWGTALGGSSLTEDQRSQVVACNPSMLVLALDNDAAGWAGAQAMERIFRYYLPEANIIVVFPPTKDWNDLAKQQGRDFAFQEYCRRVKDAQDPTTRILSRVTQILG